MTDVEDTIRRLLGDDGPALARAPIEDLSGLPNAAYQDPAWLVVEQERIFTRTWVFAAAEAEVSEPGAMLPVEVAGRPVLVVRGSDGVLRAFHNVCRHRGSQLVDTPCTASTVTCGYHRWTYGLDGSLRSQPHFGGPGINTRFDAGGGPELDLVPVRSASWHGCFFVNLDGAAPPFDEWIADCTALGPEYDLGCLRWAGVVRFEVAANWKFAYENFMEGYHVFSVHPKLLEHAPMHTRWGGEWVRQAFHNSYVAPSLTDGLGKGLPHYPGLTDEQTRAGRWFVRFPMLGLEVFADQMMLFSCTPLAPDRTLEEIHFFLVGDEAASGERWAVERQEVFDTWEQINGEDVAELERLQRGRRSPAYTGGHLSPHWEVPVHQFNIMLLDAVLAD